MPCSPWRRIPFASIAAGLMAQSIRLDRIRHRQLDTSHGCQNHTVLPYAATPVILRAVPAHGKTALRTRFAPDAAASTASRPAFVTTRDPPLLSRRDSAEIATDLGRMKSGIFLRARLDGANHVEIVLKNRPIAHAQSAPSPTRGSPTCGGIVTLEPGEKLMHHHGNSRYVTSEAKPRTSGRHR
jgi:hypothetical protein